MSDMSREEHFEQEAPNHTDEQIPWRAELLLPLWRERPKYRKLIGVDWGERRVGMAVSDLSGKIASPLTTVLCSQRPPYRPGIKTARRSQTSGQRAEKSLADVLEVIRREAPLAVCLGLPLNMDGSAGFQSQKVLLFREKLAQRLDIPVVLCDERLSSKAVERVMIREDRTRHFRQKHVDQSAAAFVLQGVVDRLNFALESEMQTDEAPAQQNNLSK